MREGREVFTGNGQREREAFTGNNVSNGLHESKIRISTIPETDKKDQ